MAQRSHLWIADKKINIHLDENGYHLLSSKIKRGLQSCKNQFIIKSFVYTKLQKFFCFSMSKLCTCAPHRYLTCFVVGCLWSWKGVLNNNLLDSSRREMMRVPFLTLFWYTLYVNKAFWSRASSFVFLSSSSNQPVHLISKNVILALPRCKKKNKPIIYISTGSI